MLAKTIITTRVKWLRFHGSSATIPCKAMFFLVVRFSFFLYSFSYSLFFIFIYLMFQLFAISFIIIKINFSFKIFAELVILPQNHLGITLECEYQGIRNVSFSEDLAYVLNNWSPIKSSLLPLWISRFFKM